MLLRTLLAVEPAAVRRVIQRAFENEGAVVSLAPSGRSLWRRLTHEDFDIVVLADSVLPDPPETFVDSIRRLPERPEIVVISPTENPEERAKLIAAGVLTVLSGQLPDEMLADALRPLFARRRRDALSRFRGDRPQERYSLGDFISLSPAMQHFMGLVHRVKSAESTLLVQGETGVGKERLARAIHNEGPRSRGPFVAINCGAFPESLLESELFGHEEGAFTGASRARRGYFELAHRGTIFLDEVAEIPVHLQAKLLRVLEERTLRRLGGEKEVAVDTRVIAATNRDLEAETKAKQFRSDLYYRLAVVTLTIPPLRERREDIPSLVQNYVDHFKTELHFAITGLTDTAMELMCNYEWPGNVRELINVIERTMLLCESETIDVADLPHAVRETSPHEIALSRLAGEASALLAVPMPEAREGILRSFEQQYLKALLGRTNGRMGDAAKQAGINVRSVHEMMKKYGMRKEDFKA